MPLTCECPEWGECEPWYWSAPLETTFPLKRGKRCCSCGAMVRTGDTGVRFSRHRPALTYVEDNIYGDEVPLAAWWMCEECGDLFWALSGLGFCISLGAEPMEELAAEYAATYGPRQDGDS